MPIEPTSKPAGPIASFIAVSKDAFALLRDAALFSVGGLLLFFPTTFNSVLTDAGFEEGSFAGLKWKADFYNTDTQLQLAQATITGLRAENKDLLDLIERTSHGTSAGETDVKQQMEIERIVQASLATTERVEEFQNSVSKTLRANQDLTDKARAAATKDAPPLVAFCYQEDNLQEGLQRYSVHCHATIEKCDSARGPNPRTKQSDCDKVNLSGAKWTPRHPGWQGSWFEFRSDSFGEPFPQLPK